MSTGDGRVPLLENARGEERWWIGGVDIAHDRGKAGSSSKNILSFRAEKNKRKRGIHWEVRRKRLSIYCELGAEQLSGDGFPM